MANKVENKKGFLVLDVSAQENIITGGYGICDSCYSTPAGGFYIAVLNRWYCPKCYNNWVQSAKFHEADKPVEQKNFDYYCKLMKI